MSAITHVYPRKEEEPSSRSCTSQHVGLEPTVRYGPDGNHDLVRLKAEIPTNGLGISAAKTFKISGPEIFSPFTVLDS